MKTNAITREIKRCQESQRTFTWFCKYLIIITHMATAKFVNFYLWSLILLLGVQSTLIAFFYFVTLIVSTVLAMGMPGPGVDHTDSASSHFMFVKRKDETAKGGLLCFLWIYNRHHLLCVDSSHLRDRSAVGACLYRVQHGVPVGVLGLHLEQPHPLSHHASHRAGPPHQPGEAWQCGHGGGLLEPVKINLET